MLSTSTHSCVGADIVAPVQLIYLFFDNIIHLTG